MATTSQDRRQEILALEPRLRLCADTMTRDAGEAHALVHETMAMAKASDYGAPDAGNAQVWLFGLLRQRFHSVERDRNYRRLRSAAVTELAEARKRQALADVVADAQNAH
jgi:DNA-directed RNA polymerase specialized sigma24 family protein